MQNKTIRIVMADDSAVIRRLLAEALKTDPEIEVVAAARHGGEAVQAVASAKPDLVLLDVEMPILDGVETVVEIRKLNPRIPIVMFSSITTRGGEATLDALAAGANDFVTKPSCQTGANAIQFIRDQLIPRIKLWGKHHDRGASILPRTVPGALVHPSASARTSGGPIEIVAIGASTGGPDALTQVLGQLPRDFPVPIVITQHMPPVFTHLLAARLDTVCQLHVREGIDGSVVRQGDVWIAPGDFHMTVRNQKADRVIGIDKSGPENSCRPAVDPLFRSVAELYGSRCLAVVLTGMGKDGEIGCGAIRRSGGRVIAQDEATSVVWGMPRAVTEAGLADRVLPLSEIAAEMVEAATYDGSRMGQKRVAIVGR